MTDGELDGVTIEIIRNRVDQAIREMEHIMFRSGYSTIIRDSKDGRAGIALADGRVIGQARNPLFFGTFTPTIEHIHERFGDDIHPGDAFVVNDPYRCGSNHTPDLLVAVPVFYEDRLRAFCINVAHKPDLGGMVPGSTSPEATEIFHEGLLLPPVKYRKAGDIDGDVEAIIRNNCRIPDVTVGDINAQLNCTHIGEEKLRGLFDTHGVEAVEAATDHLIEASRRRVGRAIEDWDGSTTVRGELDPYGHIESPIEFGLTVETAAGEPTITFDLSGSDRQVDGPSNLRPPVVHSSCIYSLLGTIDPSIPLNTGVTRACEFVLPEGSIVNPVRPAPVGNYAKSVSVIVHLGLRALSSFTAGRAIAETGGKASIAVGSRSDDEAGGDFVHFEIMGGGYGGNESGDGVSCMTSSYESNIEFTPIEIIETEFAERVVQFSIRPDSAGAGRHRGGVGFVREYEALRPLQLTYRGSKHETLPRGVDGGKTSGNARCIINPDGEDPRELDTLDTADLEAGDRVRLVRPGGAGYGTPTDRDPERVLADVRDGFVSLDGAREDYGVDVRDLDAGDYRVIR